MIGFFRKIHNNADQRNQEAKHLQSGGRHVLIRGIGIGLTVGLLTVNLLAIDLLTIGLLAVIALLTVRRLVRLAVCLLTVICLSNILEPYFVKWHEALHINRKGHAWHIFAVIRTYFVVSFGRLFSNGASIRASLHMIRSLFIPYTGGFRTAYAGFGLSVYAYAVLAVSIAVVFAVSLMQEQLYNAKMANKSSGGIIEMAGDDEGAGTDAEMREYIDGKPMLVRWGLYLTLFLAVLILGVYGPGYDASVFIYREF